MSAIAKEVTQGDISDAWAFGLKDKDGNRIEGLSCKIALVDEITKEAVIEREVVQTGDDGRHLFYLTDAETSDLVAGRTYQLVAQLSNTDLPKPIKKEAKRRIKITEGYIS